MNNNIRIIITLLIIVGLFTGVGGTFVQVVQANYANGMIDESQMVVDTGWEQENTGGRIWRTGDGGEIWRLSITTTIYLPVISNGASAYGPHPGQILLDEELDVTLACIDVLALHSGLNEAKVSSLVSEQILQATFDLRDVPIELIFDRVGVPQNALEYGWSVYVDVDNNPDTGSGFSQYKGAEYSLGAMHFVSSPDSGISKPIPNGVQVNTWRYNPDTSSWNYLKTATIAVDVEKDTMTLTGEIPEITSESRLLFVTFNYNPGGAREWDLSSE